MRLVLKSVSGGAHPHARFLNQEPKRVKEPDWRWNDQTKTMDPVDPEARRINRAFEHEPHTLTLDEFASAEKAQWHGTPWGEMGGGKTPLIHTGTWKAAHQALTAHIAGQHAPGDAPEVTPEPKREKVYRDPKHPRFEYTLGEGKSPDPKHEYVGERTWGVPAGLRPQMIPVKIVGPMGGGVRHDFAGDRRWGEGPSPESMMRGQLKRGITPKQGYYYKNEGEDSGSTSAVVPHRSWLKTHEEFVREALERGEHVPERVLADYPHLKVKKALPAVSVSLYRGVKAERVPTEMSEPLGEAESEELDRLVGRAAFGNHRLKQGERARLGELARRHGLNQGVKHYSDDLEVAKRYAGEGGKVYTLQVPRSLALQHAVGAGLQGTTIALPWEHARKQQPFEEVKKSATPFPHASSGGYEGNPAQERLRIYGSEPWQSVAARGQMHASYIGPQGEVYGDLWGRGLEHRDVVPQYEAEAHQMVRFVYHPKGSPGFSWDRSPKEPPELNFAVHAPLTPAQKRTLIQWSAQHERAGGRTYVDFYRPDEDWTDNSVEGTSALRSHPMMKSAGYKLQGHFWWRGLEIVVENRKGSVRSGVDRNGKPWRTKMLHAYGGIRGTSGVSADGDLLDVWLGPNKKSEKVFIIHQVDPQTGRYDEDKVVLWADTAEEARCIYLQGYDTGLGLGSITEMSLEQFKGKLKAMQRPGMIKAIPDTSKHTPLPWLSIPHLADTVGVDLAHSGRHMEDAYEAAKQGKKKLVLWNLEHARKHQVSAADHAGRLAGTIEDHPAMKREFQALNAADPTQAKQAEEAQEEEPGWIGVDLDSTLAYHKEWKGPEHIGRALKSRVAQVKRWLSEGKDVRIFTARAGNPLSVKAVERWCERQFGQKLPVTNVKTPSMIALYDDRSVPVPANEDTPFPEVKKGLRLVLRKSTSDAQQEALMALRQARAQRQAAEAKRKEEAPKPWQMTRQEYEGTDFGAVEHGKPATVIGWRGNGGGIRSSILSPRAQGKFGRAYMLGEGTYVAPTKKIAENYGEAKPVRVHLKNPYVLAVASTDALAKLDPEEIKRQGHDGIVVQAGQAGYGAGQESLKQLVAFDPHATEYLEKVPRPGRIAPGAKVRVLTDGDERWGHHPAGTVGTVASVSLGGHPNVRAKGKTYLHNASDVEVLGGEHEEHVRRALAEGKPVPEHVLADYPHLSKQKGMRLVVKGGARGYMARRGENVSWVSGHARAGGEAPPDRYTSREVTGMLKRRVQGSQAPMYSDWENWELRERLERLGGKRWERTVMPLEHIHDSEGIAHTRSLGDLQEDIAEAKRTRQPRWHGAESIPARVEHLKRGGELPPVILHPTGNGLHHDLVDGRHTLLAYRLAGRSHVPAIVPEGMPTVRVYRGDPFAQDELPSGAQRLGANVVSERPLSLEERSVHGLRALTPSEAWSLEKEHAAAHSALQEQIAPWKERLRAVEEEHRAAHDSLQASRTQMMERVVQAKRGGASPEERERIKAEEIARHGRLKARLMKGASVQAKRTPEFEEWFRGSKVVGEDGEPLVVYHGTGTPGFSEFGTAPSAAKSTRYQHMIGAHFTENPEVAGAYTTKAAGSPGTSRVRRGALKGGIYPVHLALKEPLNLADPKLYPEGSREWGLWKDFPAHVQRKHARLTGTASREQGFDFDGPYVSSAAIENGLESLPPQHSRAMLEKHGYDGLVYDAYYAGESNPGAYRRDRSYVAFHPHQIKSATGNRGAYDPKDPDLRKSLAGEKEPWQLHPEQMPTLQEMYQKQHAQYFDGEGNKQASSRQQPMAREAYDAPLGTWRIDTLKGAYGHEIEQLREFDPHELTPTEDFPERYADAKLYGEWAKQGSPLPPVHVVEADNGEMRVINGNRRHRAATQTGSRLRAWVSPAHTLPDVKTPGGKPVKVGLTWELAVHQARQQGKPVPREHLEIAAKNAPRFFPQSKSLRLLVKAKRPVLTGWHGGEGIGGNTEGNGLYVAHDKALAAEFGPPEKVRFYAPKKPLRVHEEPLYLLQERNDYEQPHQKGDSPWLRYHKLAWERAKREGIHPQTNWNADRVGDHLTQVMKEHGHDAVHVTSGGESWHVLLDPSLIVKER